MPRGRAPWAAEYDRAFPVPFCAPQVAATPGKPAATIRQRPGDRLGRVLRESSLLHSFDIIDGCLLVNQRLNCFWFAFLLENLGQMFDRTGHIVSRIGSHWQCPSNDERLTIQRLGFCQMTL